MSVPGEVPVSSTEVADAPVDQKSSEPSAQNGYDESESKSIDIEQILGKFQPYVEKAIDLYSLVSPYIYDGVNKVYDLYNLYVHPHLKDYPVSQVSNVALGFVLLFFGGNFAMTIACYTTLQLSGWDTVVESWGRIRTQYFAGKEELLRNKQARKQLDTNNDGKISTQEIAAFGKKWLSSSKKEKMEILQNFGSIMATIDPFEISKGLSGLWTTLVALVATLRSTFAKDIALGVSLGNTLTISFSQYIKPFLISFSKGDENHKRWVDFLIETICKFIGISIAFILVRLVSAFHSAVKGGAILARYIFKFLTNKQLVPDTANNNVSIEKTPFFMMVQYALAGYGFYWQLSNGFELNSILLRFFLFPFVMFETILMFLAAY